VLLISFKPWPIGLPSQGRYLAREEVLRVATHRCIGCYGHVRRISMESLICRGETEGHAPRHP